MVKKNIIVLVLILSSFLSFSQEISYSLGLNAYRVKYDYTYLKESYDYLNPGLVSDTFDTRVIAIGPTVRMWYTHDFGIPLKLITGFEGTVGLVPGDGSILNGFFTDVPIFIGGEYGINDGISVFSTIGGSYNVLMSYDEIHSFFGNLELGCSFDLGGDFLSVKLKFGKLLYQPYTASFPFEEKNVIHYKAGIINVGLSYIFKVSN